MDVEDSIQRTRHRLESYRRLLRSITDQRTVDILNQMVDEESADIRRLLTRR